MNPTNVVRRTLLSAISVSALFVAGPAPLNAQVTHLAVKVAQDTTYLNGGIGTDEIEYMRLVAPDWPLRMIFTQRKDNEFVAAVKLSVTDMNGKPVLELDEAGPMTYVMVPAGRYRITAQFGEIYQSRTIVIGPQSGRDVNFHWRGRFKQDPYDGQTLGGKQVPG